MAYDWKKKFWICVYYALDLSFSLWKHLPIKFRCIVTGCEECFETVEDYVDHITSHQVSLSLTGAFPCLIACFL